MCGLVDKQHLYLSSYKKRISLYRNPLITKNSIATFREPLQIIINVRFFYSSTRQLFVTFGICFSTKTLDYDTVIGFTKMSYNYNPPYHSYFVSPSSKVRIDKLRYVHFRYLNFWIFGSNYVIFVRR